jgi:ribonuclease HI
MIVAVNKSKESVLIFSDGACSGNPGPGGWGSVIRYGGQVREIGGGERSTTNNRMELTATIEALKEISGIETSVNFYTDSTYVIRGITQWIWGWKRNGWKTAEGNEVSNKEFWQALHALVQDRGVEGRIDWRYSRGHVGTPGNERCDEIAVAFSKNQSIDLYHGSEKNYSVDLNHLPADHSLPDMKSPGEKKKAHSYLSNIGGIVYRHKDWPSCQRRVGGKSGAKFKKAFSAQEENEILKSWGLGPQTSILEG